VDRNLQPYERRWQRALDADTTWVSWLVARNAVTLLGAPTRLYDTEHCAPFAHSLTLGDPMLTQSFLAVPATLVGASGTAAFNTSLHFQKVVQAGAMYALVLEWTLSPPAAIASGLLFAFHPTWVRDVSHPYIYDTAWCVLALLFAHRLVLRGRWRDAIGLGVAGGMQLGTSLYPAIGSLLVLLPYGVWLLIRQKKLGQRRVRAVQLASVAVIAAAFGAMVYGPFLATRSVGGVLAAVHQNFATLSSFGPGGEHYLGVVPILLAIAAMAIPRARALAGIDGDPRPALAIGGLLVVLAACGPRLPAMLPDVYAWLAALLPGLDAVRAPVRVAATLHVPLCILAGIALSAAVHALEMRGGGAEARALSKSVPGLITIALIALLVLTTAMIAPGPLPPYRTVDLTDDPEVLAFFDELAARGSSGPLLELPMERNQVGLLRIAQRIHASAHHGRRTSACYGSFQPPILDEVEGLTERLDEPASFDRLAALGFTTVVLHPGAVGSNRLALELSAEASKPNARLLELHATPSRIAYTILAR
jgi:hypothetical protein